MATEFFKLKVFKLNKATKEATTITFQLPKEAEDKFSFYPGQHLVIKFRINGEEVRRSYSLNSCPKNGEPLQVTVKKVKGGLVSNFVNEKLKVGDGLEAMSPQGRFFAQIKPEHYKTYFLFAAGSGITPIISILKSVLFFEPYSSVNLIYGNKNKSSIIFYDELEALKKEYPDRLAVIYSLSAPYSDWSTIWDWNERKGRIDKDTVEWFIEHHPPMAQATEYFICGPEKMNTSVQSTLLEMGIPKTQIHIEQFGGAVEESAIEIPAVDAKMTAMLNGQSLSFDVPKGKTILQVLISANANPPYSCESGVCATCVAKLTKGTAAMKSCMALDDSEIEQGMVLTCQALPTAAEIKVEF